MLVFNDESQGWFPCKIVETVPHEELWTVNWWDNSQEDRVKGEEGLRPFEEPLSRFYAYVEEGCHKR